MRNLFRLAHSFIMLLVVAGSLNPLAHADADDVKCELVLTSRDLQHIIFNALYHGNWTDYRTLVKGITNQDKRRELVRSVLPGFPPYFTLHDLEFTNRSDVVDLALDALSEWQTLSALNRSDYILEQARLADQVWSDNFKDRRQELLNVWPQLTSKAVDGFALWSQTYRRVDVLSFIFESALRESFRPKGPFANVDELLFHYLKLPKAALLDFQKLSWPTRARFYSAAIDYTISVREWKWLKLTPAHLSKVQIAETIQLMTTWSMNQKLGEEDGKRNAYDLPAALEQLSTSVQHHLEKISKDLSMEDLDRIEKQVGDLWPFYQILAGYSDERMSYTHADIINLIKSLSASAFLETKFAEWTKAEGGSVIVAKILKPRHRLDVFRPSATNPDKEQLVLSLPFWQASQLLRIGCLRSVETCFAFTGGGRHELLKFTMSPNFFGVGGFVLGQKNFANAKDFQAVKAAALAEVVQQVAWTSDGRFVFMIKDGRTINSLPEFGFHSRALVRVMDKGRSVSRMGEIYGRDFATPMIETQINELFQEILADLGVKEDTRHKGRNRWYDHFSDFR